MSYRAVPWTEKYPDDSEKPTDASFVWDGDGREICTVYIDDSMPMAERIAAALNAWNESKSVPSDAERRLRELARIVDMAEGFDDRFGSEAAAEHELSAISEAFVAARKEGCDSYTSLCRALDVGTEPPKPGGEIKEA